MSSALGTALNVEHIIDIAIGILWAIDSLICCIILICYCCKKKNRNNIWAEQPPPYYYQQPTTVTPDVSNEKCWLLYFD